MKRFTKVIGISKNLLETKVVEEVHRDNVESAFDYISKVKNKDSIIWILEPMWFDEGGK